MTSDLDLQRQEPSGIEKLSAGSPFANISGMVAIGQNQITAA